MQYANIPRDNCLPEQRPVNVTLIRNEKISQPVPPDEIIGRSDAIRNIMQLIGKVAPSETTVLILGETGTGKELIARAIHRHSPRRSKPLVKVNCGALPASLVESELFGHEKGSFTGASERRIGKFERAHGGTIFLDEIGEMPPELQVKLLRVLQEKELERIGGSTSIKVDVRIIAATNRQLENEMAAGRFRADLYYRLNVFPLTVPPLRERRSDIPLLAAHFLRQYCIREKKGISRIPPDHLAMLTRYHWPGNIRELENIIARSVLLSTGDEFCGDVIPAAVQNHHPSAQSRILKTMAQNEKDHILQALAVCNDKIHGPGGAAALLNINASTLVSRMKKLGIRRRFSA